MPVPVRCPFCAAGVSAEPGQVAACPACGANFVAPGAGAPPQPSAAPPPPSAPMGSAGDMPCPMCGELIKSGAKICRHCKANLGAPVPVGPPAPGYYTGGPPPPKKKSGCMIAVWVILGIVVVCCGGSVVTWLVARESLGKSACEEQMKKLSPHVRALAKDDDDKIRDYDLVRGTDFWRRVADKAGDDSLSVCMGAAIIQFKQRAFRGPKKPFSEIGEKEPVGCCPFDAHKEGVWVVYKNGDYRWAPKGSDDYKKAQEELTD